MTQIVLQLGVDWHEDGFHDLIYVEWGEKDSIRPGNYIPLLGRLGEALIWFHERGITKPKFDRLYWNSKWVDAVVFEIEDEKLAQEFSDWIDTTEADWDKDVAITADEDDFLEDL